MISKTLSPDNQLRIQCPVFNAETRIASCFTLRDIVWRGERPAQRAGCQCALIAGKCPIPVVLQRMIRTREDALHSTEPKVVKFDDETLDRISTVIITDTEMRRHSLSPQEEKALARCNEDARSGKREIKKAPRRMERVIDDDPPKADVDNKIAQAAKTGDLGAAISTEKTQ